MKSLRQYISKTERAFGITKYMTEELHDVIVKVGDIIKKWQTNEFHLKEYEGHTITKW